MCIRLMSINIRQSKFRQIEQPIVPTTCSTNYYETQYPVLHFTTLLFVIFIKFTSGYAGDCAFVLHMHVILSQI